MTPGPPRGGASSAKAAATGTRTTYVTVENFVVLLGGPGIYEPLDKAHDKAWHSYVNPILLAAKAGSLLIGRERCTVLMYRPAYDARWRDDDATGHKDHRHEDVASVQKSGAADYIDYVTKKLASYPNGSKYTVRPIPTAASLWSTLASLPDRSISRVWYSGHGSDALWLSLTHSGPTPTAPAASAIVARDHIDVQAKLAMKFMARARPSIFLACNTDTFAERWAKVFKVPAEGADGTVNFGSLTVDAIKKTAKQWLSY